MTDDDVVELFRLVLNRAPESDAVIEHHRALGLDRVRLARLLSQSPEAREGQRRRAALDTLAAEAGSRAWPRPDGASARVLLWGAFGNGNLGDAAQACAMADLLRPLVPVGTVFGASSWERRAGYDAPDGLRLPSGAALHPQGVDADLLVIGGGGLFGTPHFPLHELAWVDVLVARGTPVVIVGVGGAAEALAAHETAYARLLRHAAWVGVRDAETLVAMRRWDVDAVWFPDPLMARALAATAPSDDARPLDILLVPRAPNGRHDADALDEMLAWSRAAAARGARIEWALLEPVLDRPALVNGGVEGGHEPQDWAALVALFRQARVVASLRLHGAIAGLEAGCVVHGLTQPKTRLLFEELGLGAWFTPGWPNSMAMKDPGFAASRDAGFALMRDRLRVATVGLGQALARQLCRGAPERPSV